MGSRTTLRTLLRLLSRSAGIAGLSLILAVVLFHFIFQPFQVAGLSMAPSLEDRDYLLVDRVFYRLDAVGRGDIVVFHSPADGRFLVKRVAALPGDLVEAAADGSIRVNGQVRVPPGETVPTTEIPSHLVVPAGSLYLLGDNLGHSQDSRVFGVVPMDSLYGRVLLRYYPLSPIANAPTAWRRP